MIFAKLAMIDAAIFAESQQVKPCRLRRHLKNHITQRHPHDTEPWRRYFYPKFGQKNNAV